MLKTVHTYNVIYPQDTKNGAHWHYKTHYFFKTHNIWFFYHTTQITAIKIWLVTCQPLLWFWQLRWSLLQRPCSSCNFCSWFHLPNLISYLLIKRAEFYFIPSSALSSQKWWCFTSPIIIIPCISFIPSLWPNLHLQVALHLERTPFSSLAPWIP